MTYTLWYFCNLLCTTIRDSWTKQIDLLWGFILSTAAARHLGTSCCSPAVVCPQPELSSRRRSPPIIDLTPPTLAPILNSCFAPFSSPAARRWFPLARAPSPPPLLLPAKYPSRHMLISSLQPKFPCQPTPVSPQPKLPRRLTQRRSWCSSWEFRADPIWRPCASDRRCFAEAKRANEAHGPAHSERDLVLGTF